MELRRYWDIIWRYLPVVLALPLLVGLGSSALFLTRPRSYKAETKVQVLLVSPAGTPAPNPAYFTYGGYYDFLATEYAVDDLAEVLNGNVFAAAVRETLGGPPFNLALRDEEVRGTFRARRAHRVLLIDATTGDRDRSKAIANAAVLTLQRDPLRYFSKVGLAPEQKVAALPIDSPLEARGNRVAGLFNVALQTLLALFAGLGLAFLLDYLNDRIRDADGARDALDLPVLGQIPAHRPAREAVAARRMA